jgi:outer membrane protein TolC
VTDLEQAKVAFADASIQLEIAQGKYNEAKQKLVIELNKPAEVKPTE